MRNHPRLTCWAGMLLLSAAGCLVGTPCLADLWGTSVDFYGFGTTPANYNKVFRFDNAGNKLPNDIPFNSAGLSGPTGLAIGPDGTIYVSSSNTGKILFFDGQTGAPRDPLEGTDPGVFTVFSNDPIESDQSPAGSPAQMSFGPDGLLYVSTFFGRRVRVYDPVSGDRLDDAVDLGPEPERSAQGHAFIPNSEGGYDLLVGDGLIQGEGQTARIVRVHNGVVSEFTNQVSGAVSMLTMADGSVLVADVISNYVLHFANDGTPLAPFAYMPPPVVPPQTNSPSDLKYDPDGNIIVSVLGATTPPDNPGALWRFDLNGNIIDPDNDATPNEPITSGIEPIGGIDWTPAAATLHGDFDGNNTVDGADYAKWRAAFGKFLARGNGVDGSRNGVADAADYVLWRMQPPAGSASLAASAVPEPATLPLVLVGLSGLMRTRARVARGGAVSTRSRRN